MPSSSRAALHPGQVERLGTDQGVSPTPNGDATNGVPRNTSVDFAPVSLMSDSVGPKNTNVMHVAFPVSKQAVRNFRGELEDNIEFKVKPNGAQRLRDLLIPGSSHFNQASAFVTPRGFEQPIISGRQATARLNLEDLMSSPINAEANPAPSPIPL